jgi:dTDP-4-amino-4,6-dideoxygalactose transaminase
VIKSLRVHGQGNDKYDNVRIGMNGRLDTLQAAILIEKLKIFPDEIKARQKVADYYHAHLKDIVDLPVVLKNVTSVWAQFTIKLPQGIDRSNLMSSLKENGIPTVVYYVKPLHQQQAYKNYPTATMKDLPVCESLSQTVMSLPMCGYTSESSLAKICKTLQDYI